MGYGEWPVRQMGVVPVPAATGNWGQNTVSANIRINCALAPVSGSRFEQALRSFGLALKFIIQLG